MHTTIHGVPSSFHTDSLPTGNPGSNPWPLLPGLSIPTTLPAAGQVSESRTCDGDRTLREAVIAANARRGLARVEVSAGYYTRTLDGVSEDSDRYLDLEIRNDLTHPGGRERRQEPSVPGRVS